jgi:AAA15 family ATPase/GTPase
MNINRVKVENFKSLVNIDLELKNLTIITGVNSSGKSSFIQSLLLFKENDNNILLDYIMTKNTKLNNNVKIEKRKLSFNGEYLNIGDPKMLLSQNSSSDLMLFEIEKMKIY